MTTAIYLDITGGKAVGLPMQSLSFKSVIVQPSLKDFVHGGAGSISGTVKDPGSPSDIPEHRRVRLHRKIDGMLIRETWSAADGTYSFPHIAVQSYYVTSFDHTGDYNAVIKDSIVPV